MFVDKGLQGTFFSLTLLMYSSLVQAYNTTLLRDVTAVTGIDFRHSTGAFLDSEGRPSRYMPETMGSGVALFDLDNDNDIDILLVNSTGFSKVAQSIGGTPALYRNDGHWRFTEITKESGLDISLYGMGACIADYDGDSDLDILFTSLQGVHLYQNNNGHFKDVTQVVGLNANTWIDNNGKSGTEWSTGAVFFDADGDLDLDLVSIQYVRWSISNDIYTTYDAFNKGYTSPRNYQGQSLRLWLQQNKRFVDATSQSGLELKGKSLGIALWDFDNDQQLDMVVANDTIENFLFRNLGNGKFKNIAIEAGVALDRNGNARAGMGIDIADYNNDNLAAIAIGNFSGEPTSVFRQGKNGYFSEDSVEVNVSTTTRSLLTFGLLFADIDLDGWIDLVTTNGHIEPNIATAFDNESYPQPLQWLRNQGNGKFIAAGSHITALKKPMVGRGLASADLDGDGDLDIVASSNNGIPRVIKNNLSKQRYLRIKLVGKSPNTNAIGARIKLVGTEKQQQRIIRTGGSYLSQSEMIQTFGLAKNETIQSVIIVWPDGFRNEIKNPKYNHMLTIHHPTKKK